MNADISTSGEQPGPDTRTQSAADALQGPGGDALDRGRPASPNPRRPPATICRATCRSCARTWPRCRRRCRSSPRPPAAKPTGPRRTWARRRRKSAGRAKCASTAKEQIKTFASEIETMTRRNPLGAIGATLLGRRHHRHDVAGTRLMVDILLRVVGVDLQRQLARLKARADDFKNRDRPRNQATGRRGEHHHRASRSPASCWCC